MAISGQAALASVQFDVGANGPTGNHWVLDSGWGTGSAQLDAVFKVNANLPNEVFSLKPGQSYCFNFGTVQLRDAYIDASATDHLGVTADVLFDAPQVGQVSNPGSAVAFVGSVSDSATDLKITFNPVYVNFGQGGKFQIDLTDLCFSQCGTLCVDACVTLCSEACHALPEPATLVIWSVFGAGFLGTRVCRRRRGIACSERDAVAAIAIPRRRWSDEQRIAIRQTIERGRRQESKFGDL
jgi:hypothetical protein